MLWAYGCLGLFILSLLLLWLLALVEPAGLGEAVVGFVMGLFNFFIPLSLACFLIAAWQFGYRGGGLGSLGLGLLYMGLFAWGLHSLVGWPVVFLGMASVVLLAVLGKVFAS